MNDYYRVLILHQSNVILINYSKFCGINWILPPVISMTEGVVRFKKKKYL